MGMECPLPRGRASAYTVAPMTAPAQRDVVEVLLEAHVETRQVLAMADSLAASNAVVATQEIAAHVADYLEWLLPLHCEDEDASIEPRLKGRHPVVDDALVAMTRQHAALQGPLARLRLVCRQVANDVTRLHALRFELSRAAVDLRARLAEHTALEESIVFPALKRMLYVDELEDIATEMLARRGSLAA